MDQNIKISYTLAYLKSSWFWVGVWVFFYLLYTNYAGIGLLETVLILTMTTMEIPTGALGDLLGKKFTLLISFILQTLGNAIMGFATGLPALGLGVFIAATGSTMYSGTSEALVYDSLKESHQVNLFDKVLSRISSIQLIAIAVSSVLGGFLYRLSPGLPFLGNAIACAMGIVLTLFIKEPHVDTQKFSLKSFLSQNRQGLVHLLKSPTLKPYLFILLSVASIVVLPDEMLNDVLAVEFGFQETHLALFVAATLIVSAAISHLTPTIRSKLGSKKSILVASVIIALMCLISPWAGLILGGITILIRYSTQVVFTNLTSIILNSGIESHYRATALSAFNMIKNIPYLLTAYLLGFLMDVISAKRFSFILGILLFVCILIGASILQKSPHQKNQLHF